MTSKEFRAWMERGKWTNRGLARELDVYPSTIARYRSGALAVPRTLELALVTLTRPA